MTSLKAKRNKSLGTVTGKLVGAFALLVLMLSLISAEEIKDWALAGLKLAATSVIPSVFPFMVLSDFISSTGLPGMGLFGRALNNVFGLSPVCSGAIICGNLCGFPLGARMATEEYRRGTITKEELEDTIGPANNPSLAFVISVVGVGFWGSVGKGIMLYIAVISATAAVGIVFKRKSINSRYSRDNIRQSYNLARSIKDAGIASVGIISYMVFFSSAAGLIHKLSGSELLCALISPLLEVGLGTSLISSCGLAEEVAFGLTAFALGFSGFSVHMQVRMLLPEDVSMRKYYSEKMLEGVLAGACAFITFPLTYYIF